MNDESDWTVLLLLQLKVACQIRAVYAIRSFPSCCLMSVTCKFSLLVSFFFFFRFFLYNDDNEDRI